MPHILTSVAVQIPETASCLGCGYALRGLEGHVCPECGRAFDPSDKSTYREPGRPIGWRRLAKAPPLWHLAGIPTFMVAYPYWSSVPGGLLAGLGFRTLVVGPTGILIALGFAADYVARVVAVICDRRRASMDRGGTPLRNRLRWAVTPLCVAVLVSAAVTRWPMRVRFQLSRDAFERVVRQLETGADPRSQTGRIGLFQVRSITRYGTRGVYFQTGMSGFDRVGLDHCSDDEGCQYGQLPLDPNWSADMY